MHGVSALACEIQACRQVQGSVSIACADSKRGQTAQRTECASVACAFAFFPLPDKSFLRSGRQAQHVEHETVLAERFFEREVVGQLIVKELLDSFVSAPPTGTDVRAPCSIPALVACCFFYDGPPSSRLRSHQPRTHPRWASFG